jgi:hypothetical protein
MWRSWRGLEEWTRFGGLLVIVVAVIRGQVNREIAKKRSPVTRLARRHSFIVNVSFAHQRDQRRSALGPPKTGEVCAASGIGLSGRSVGLGNCGPKHVMRASCPRHARAR